MRARAVAIALVVAAFAWSVAGLTGIAGAKGSSRHEGSREVVAEFPRTVGLYAGDQVRVLGLPAGEVTAVEPKVDHVEVTMKVDDVALAPDAIAALRLRSLIGERFVELGPMWDGKGEALDDGGTIPIERTTIPAEISDVLDEATRLAEGLDADAASKLLGELAKAFGGRHDAVAGLTAQLADVGNVLRGRAAEIDRGLAQLDTVVSTLAERDDTMVELLQGSAAVTDALLAQDGALDASIQGLDALLGEVGSFTAEQKERLVTLVGHLDTVGTILADHQEDFAAVVEELPYFSYGYERAIQNDGDRWYVVNYPRGLLFLPTGEALNSRGGVGTDPDDARLMPQIDHTGNPVAQALVPEEVDATQVTGPGPLVPGMSVGEPGMGVRVEDDSEKSDPGDRP